MEVREHTVEDTIREERDAILHLEMPPGEYVNRYPEWGIPYMLLYSLARPFKEDAKMVERTKGTSIKPDRSANLVLGFGQIVQLAMPMPKGVQAATEEANLAKDIGLRFFEVADTKTQATLGSPRAPVTFSAVTRGEVTIFNVNNQKIYDAFLKATEEGAVALKPGEYIGSPPFKSGEMPHPDWNSPRIHAETQGERELAEIFDLRGPGTAWSHPNPGCDWCVPWISKLGIVHQNPKPTVPIR